jgi:LacI family transcriptional regulator
MVTRNDVAQAAGVSTAVVSYVVNGGPRPVSVSTRRRVQKAIKELGYRPNGIARALATQRTHALGLVIPNAVNPFFAHLAQAVEGACFARGQTLILGSAEDDPDIELAYVRTMVERNADAVILSPSASSEGALALLSSAGVPTVVVDRVSATSKRFDTIEVDNFAGGYAAAAHLREHGHTAIACLAGPSEIPTARERKRGWSAYLEQSDEREPGSVSVTAAFTKQAAYEATRALLSGPEAPSALFATSDEHTPGIYRAAADLGLCIPRDLALVSFDNAETAEFMVPGLTTVHQPLHEMADLAVELTLARLLEPRRAPTHSTLPVRLIPRGSCGCADLGPGATVAAVVSDQRRTHRKKGSTRE